MARASVVGNAAATAFAAPRHRQLSAGHAPPCIAASRGRRPVPTYVRRQTAQPALPALAAVSSPHCFSSVAAPSAAAGAVSRSLTPPAHTTPTRRTMCPWAWPCLRWPQPLRRRRMRHRCKEPYPLARATHRPAIAFGPVRLCRWLGLPMGAKSLLSPVAAPRACLRVQLRGSSAGSSSMKSCMPVAGIKAGSHKAMAATASWPTCRVCSYACDALRAGHVHTRLSIVASIRPLVCCKFALMSHRVAMAELE